MLIGNFYAIAPELVESGFFHLVTPPYYEMSYGSSGGKGSAKKDRIFFRDDAAVEDWKVKFYYQEAFQFHLLTDHGHVTCNQQQATAVCRAVIRTGEILERMASEFSVPEVLVEQLAAATAFLPEYGQPLRISEQHLARILGSDYVTYDIDTYILTVSAVQHDYVIPLHGILESLRKNLVPLMNHIGRCIRNPNADRLPTEIYITTKNTPLYRQIPMGLWDIYAHFRSLDSNLKFKTFKGLAGMQPEDKTRTCIDPEWRQTFQIRSIGDVDTILTLLGKGSEGRKQLSNAAA